jgi:Heterokaryon incompatibility protein (HET)
LSDIPETSGLTSYQYQTLDTPGRQGDIRLVELLPNQKKESNTNSIIACRLHIISFQDCPPYEALSYHWGDSSVTLPITLDGKPFYVTINLAEALHCLAPPEKSRFLWIDAICINQSDSSERSHQVQRMGRIYNDAKRVLVWLGAGDPDTLSAFQRLAKEEEYRTLSIQDLETRRELRIVEDVSTIPSTEPELLQDSYSDVDDELPILRRPTMGLTESTNEEIAAIHKIFQHPWWERVWVIQEATLARELCIVCGGHELPWNMLCQIYPVTFTRPGQLQISPHEKNLEPLRRLNNMRITWKVFQNELQPSPKTNIRDTTSGRRVNFDILSLVSEFRTSKATDSRDKIYSLLGLASDGKSMILDYSISTVQLYVRFAIQDLEDCFTLARYQGLRRRTLRILNYCLPSPQLRGLPSWVPDWTVSIPFSSVGEELGGEAFGVSSNAGGENDQWQGFIQSTYEPYTLNVWGLEIDKVSKIGNIITLSADFLRPLFLAWVYLNAPPVHGGISNRHITENQLRWLTERLSELSITFKTAADSENTNERLFFFLNRLFYVDACQIGGQTVEHEVHNDAIDDMNIRLLLEHLRQAKSSKRFFTTDRGRFGLARIDIQEGDRVCVFFGGADPYILRKEGGHYIFVGNCFCEGLMLGEGMKDLKEGKIAAREFVIH